MAKKAIGMDISGYDILTNAVRSLLNKYPGLSEDDIVTFEDLPTEEPGIAFSNNAGALVYSEKEDITGMVYQECQYPFYVVYRLMDTASEKLKLLVIEFLDNLGKWICKEPVTIDGQEYKLTEYPELSHGRKIIKIMRDNSYGTDPQENGVQDWVLPVSVTYTNEFERN